MNISKNMVAITATQLLEMYKSMDFPKVKDLLCKYSYLGTHESLRHDIQIGWVPQIAEFAYLNDIFPPLSPAELQMLKQEVPYPFPAEYEHFLTHFSNGLSAMVGRFCIYGLRREMMMEDPYAPATLALYLYNVLERPRNATKDLLIIGGYSADHSHIYMKQGDTKVYYCKQWDVTPLKTWPSFEDMLSEEIARVSALFNEETGQLHPEHDFLPL